MDYVRTVARFKDPGVEQQMNEVVQKANSFFGNLDTHALRKDNPHQVTAKQVGAETPAGAQAKVDQVQAKVDQVQAKLTAHQNELLPYVFKKNATTGTLEIFYQLTKIGELDSLGNLKLKGVVTPEASI